MPATFHIGDTRQVVANLPDGSVDLVLTSPPFLALRSYLPADHPDKAREIGSEPDPASFVQTMLELTAEWRRVLAPHGSIAIEFGDTYSGSSGDNWHKSVDRIHASNGADSAPGRYDWSKGWPLPKSLTLVPELYRVALAYGRHPLTGDPSPAGRWRVRNVVRWVRPNPPVGALGDKFRPATSDLVMACTASDRWFDLDAVRTELAYPDSEGKRTRGGKLVNRQGISGGDIGAQPDKAVTSNPAGAPPLDWWQIVPKGYDGAHYATYPPELCIKPIEAMCPRRVCRTCGTPSRRETSEPEYERTDSDRVPARLTMLDGQRPAEGVNQHTRTDGANTSVTRVTTTTGWTSCGCPGTDGIRLDGFHTGTGWRPGIVLDPFAGSGTTLMVATGHGRDAIGIDLDERNADLARERLGMFLDVA